MGNSREGDERILLPYLGGVLTVVLLPNCTCCPTIKCLNFFQAGQPYYPDYIEVDLDMSGVSAGRTETWTGAYSRIVTTSQFGPEGELSLRSRVTETTTYNTSIPPLSGRFRFYPYAPEPGRYFATEPYMSCYLAYGIQADTLVASLAFSYYRQDGSTKTLVREEESWSPYGDKYWGGYTYSKYTFPPTTTPWHGYGMQFVYSCGNTNIQLGYENAQNHGQARASPLTQPGETVSSTPNTIACGNFGCKWDATMQTRFARPLPLKIDASVAWCASKTRSTIDSRYSDGSDGWPVGTEIERTTGDWTGNGYLPFSPCASLTPCNTSVAEGVGFRALMQIKEIDIFKDGLKTLSLSEKPVFVSWGSQFGTSVVDSGDFCPSRITYPL